MITEQKQPRERHDRSREHLIPEEVTKLLKASKSTRHSERDYCLLLMMARHGLRAEEAAELKVSDIHLSQRNMYVNRLKGSTSSTHPLYNGEIKAIKDWMEKRKQMLAGRKDPSTVFVSNRGGKLSRSMIWHIVHDCAELAGLSELNVHPHMLRHACGYDLANRGMDTRGIQEYLGHTNIQNTVRYTALSPNRFTNVSWSF
jgi:type 1 fimbriae regulatory protein FimB